MLLIKNRFLSTLWVSALLILLAACTSGSIHQLPPNGFSYICSECEFTVGQAINPLIPNLSDGDQIGNYKVSPALPAGLSLNPTSGVISGTPIGESAPATYTITGSNSAGSIAIGLSIQIGSVVTPPSLISYESPDINVKLGTTIDPLNLYAEGQIDYCLAEGNFPDGITLNEQTGEITGTPTTESVNDVIIYCGNSAGDASFNLTITASQAQVAPVLDPASNTALTFVINKPIALSAPIQYSGGQITGFRTDDTLPAGLALDSDTGQILGTPTVLGTTPVTIIGEWAGGTVSLPINITVANAPSTFVGIFSLGTINSLPTNINVYFTGAYYTTQIVSLTGAINTDTYEGAKAFCETTVSQALGGKWELPGNFFQIMSIVAGIKTPAFDGWSNNFTAGSIWEEAYGGQGKKLINSITVTGRSTTNNFNGELVQKDIGTAACGNTCSTPQEQFTLTPTTANPLPTSASCFKKD